MDEGWAELNLGASSGVVATLDSFKTQLQGAISAVETIVSIAKTVGDLVLKFYFELENVEVEVLKAAIGALKSVIEDLSESAGAYGLFVPMHIVDPYAWTGDPETFYLGNRDTLGFPFLETSDGVSYINKPAGGSAGNFGFYATVAESLADQQDILRPQFDEDAYVASVVLLFGTDTYMELVLLAKKLIRLFKLPGVNLDNATMPTPRDLRARVVPTPLTGDAIVDQQYVGKGDFSTKPYSVRLEWTPDDTDWLLAAYGNAKDPVHCLTDRACVHVPGGQWAAAHCLAICPARDRHVPSKAQCLCHSPTREFGNGLRPVPAAGLRITRRVGYTVAVWAVAATNDGAYCLDSSLSSRRARAGPWGWRGGIAAEHLAVHNGYAAGGSSGRVRVRARYLAAHGCRCQAGGSIH